MPPSRLNAVVRPSKTAASCCKSGYKRIVLPLVSLGIYGCVVGEITNKEIHNRLCCVCYIIHIWLKSHFKQRVPFVIIINNKNIDNTQDVACVSLNMCVMITGERTQVQYVFFDECLLSVFVFAL